MEVPTDNSGNREDAKGRDSLFQRHCRESGEKFVVVTNLWFGKKSALREPKAVAQLMCRLISPRVGRVGKNFPCSPEVSQDFNGQILQHIKLFTIDVVTEKHAMFENFQRVENECYGAKILAPLPKFWLFREIYKAVSRTREIKLIDFKTITLITLLGLLGKT